MNIQEAFNKVWDWTIVQNQPKSENQFEDTNYCLYRGQNNTKCFIGALIPDDLYQESMEKNSVDALVTDFPTISNLLEINNDTLAFYMRMQTIHDYEFDKREIYLRTLARDYHLTVPS